MGRKKYNLYIMDKDNRFLKDCFHEYFTDVRSFEDHFSAKEMAIIRKIRRKKKAEAEKQEKILKKAHKYYQ